MLLKIKQAMANAANLPTPLGDFQTLDMAELEQFAQQFDFTTPLIRLEPMNGGLGSIDEGGVIHTELDSKLWFLTKFQKDDDDEDGKDILIDQMEEVSIEFNRRLNKSQTLSQGSLADWVVSIERQITSNLLCGVMVTLKLNSACNRI